MSRSQFRHDFPAGGEHRIHQFTNIVNSIYLFIYLFLFHSDGIYIVKKKISCFKLFLFLFLLLLISI